MRHIVNIQCALLLLMHIAYSGNPVKVTFQVNTCGVPDMITTSSTVQIRGSMAPLTWTHLTSARMVNVSGDYWKWNGSFNPGDTVDFKFFTSRKSVVTESDSGWEGTLTDWGNGNRRIIVGQNDTILPMQYVNGYKTGAGQYEAPFNIDQDDDTVRVFLKVNVESAVKNSWFNPLLNKLGIRGSFAASNWGTSTIMTPMAPHPNIDSRQYDAQYFYTTAISWCKSALDSPMIEGTMRWKYVIHYSLSSPNNEDWSKLWHNQDGIAGEFIMPKRDTIIAWSWYFKPPELRIDTLVISDYLTDMKNAIHQKQFAVGDSLWIEIHPDNLKAEFKKLFMMHLVDSIGIYKSRDTILNSYYIPPGVPLPDPRYCRYRYIIVKNGVEYPEEFVDTFSQVFPRSHYRLFSYSSANRREYVLNYDMGPAPSMHQMPFWTEIVKVSDFAQFPNRFSLNQNFPNPFNPQTTIRYFIPVDSHVRLSVFDLLGRELAVLVDEVQTAGERSIQFNGSRYSSGVYFYKISSDNYSQIKTMMLLK